MAYAITGFDGGSPARLAPAVGSFTPLIPFSITISGTTTTEDIVFPNLSVIRGAILIVLDSGNNILNGAVGADLTWSGNTLTIADGTNFNLDAAGQVLYGMVWGNAKF